MYICCKITANLVINSIRYSSIPLFFYKSNCNKFKFHQLKSAWTEKLDDITNSTVESSSGKIRPRHALRALEKGLPADSIVSTDIGNICSVSNSYLSFKWELWYFREIFIDDVGQLSVPYLCSARKRRAREIGAS